MQNVRQLAAKTFSESNKFLKSAITKGTTMIKGTVLQELAKRMAPEDAKYLSNEWKNYTNESVLEGEKSAQQSTTLNEATSSPSSSLPQNTETKEITNLSVTEALSPVIKEEVKEHATFGRLIADVGYKRVYLSSVTNLVNAEVWNKQRILRGDRAKAIVAAKLSTNKEPCFPGVIALFQDKDSGEYGIIDGQHRVAALILMAANKKWSKSDRNVMIEVFQTSGEADVESLFRDINSAEPVQMIDMPGNASDETREILEQATEELRCQFHSAMFSDSPHCKRPHVNLDNLRNDLFETSYLMRHDIKSTAELVESLRKQNSQLLMTYTARGSDGKKVPGLVKALKHGFALGLDKKWLEN